MAGTWVTGSPETREAPLMLFTLTTQLGLGFLPVAVFLQGSDASATGRPVLNHAAPSALLIGLALGLVAFGLLASVLHLARPWRSPLALCNLRRSWLSREVLLTSAAAGGLLLDAGTAPGPARSVHPSSGRTG